MPQFFHQEKFQAEEFNHTGLNVHVRRGREASAAVVFVHGLGGAGYETWGMWPQLVFDQASVQALDVALYQYASVYKAWKKRKRGADLPFQVAQLADWIRVLSEDHGYSDIYLVGHSLGGLVAEAAVYEYLTELGKNPPEVTAVAAIYVLASPRLGAGLALSVLRNVLPEFEWLRRKSPQLLKAESYFNGHVEGLGTAASAGHHDFLIPRYSAMAGGDRLVSKMSGLFGVPEKQRLRLEGNHRSIVKPDEINQGQHQRLLKIVKESGAIRQAWRLQNQHAAKFDPPPNLGGPLLVAELANDNIDVRWGKAYNRACIQASSGNVEVSDRQSSKVPPGQSTDILVTVLEAQDVFEGTTNCKMVIDNALERHRNQTGIMLLIVMVGPDVDRAESVVKSWLPDPPYQLLRLEKAKTPGHFTGLIAAWIEVMIERDPIRWPQSESGSESFYGAEGSDFA